MKGLAATFIELFQKKAPLDKRLDIHENGIGNNYPELVESRIENSVTALRCKNLMASYIAGRGFGDDNNKVIVHPDKGTTLLDFTQQIADSIATHYGVFVHANYNGNYEIKSLDVLPFGDCKIGRKDDDGYTGKIHICSDWSDSKLSKNAIKIDAYNPDKKVIQAQVSAAKGINKYNGQIYYFHFGKYTYPIAPLHPCLDDAESEQKSSKYKNTILTKGFFGKDICVTKPLINVNLTEDDDDYKIGVEKREAFKETLKKFIGADNADGILHLEMDFEGDDIEKEMIFKTIESNINDKLFSYTESSVANNIRMCFNNVPPILINAKESMFGPNGSALIEAKKFYQDETERERLILQEIVIRLMCKMVKPVENLEIVPLLTEVSVENDPDEARKKAQATLKGSVGGVTALLQIQQSVAEEKTDRSAAIAIIEEIFGIEKTRAAEMLGSPELENDGAVNN